MNNNNNNHNNSPSRMMRRSIFTFLKNFHHLSSTPSLLLLPFAASTLLSPPLTASWYLFPLVHGRLRSLFLAAGIPPQSQLFAILNLKLSQTIISFIFSLPFTLSFLLLGKAAVVRLLHHHDHDRNNTILSWIKTLNRLLITQSCSSLLILSANATCFCLLAVSFNISDVLGLSSARFQLLVSATGAIVYSIVLANAYVVCSLAMIASAADGCSGISSILKACVAIRGRTSTALSLALPMNVALAAIEALFQYRVVRAYNRASKLDSSMVLESILVAYLYSMVLVLDTVVGYVFLKSCKAECQIHRLDFDFDICSQQESKDFESVL